MRTGFLFLLLLLAWPAFAADGGKCDAGAGLRGGSCLYLCDGKSDAGTCNGGAGVRTPENYYGGSVTLELQKATGCSAAAVSIWWASTSTGAVKHGIVTLSLATDTAHTEFRGVHFPGWVFATVDSETGCSADGLDVVAHFE